MPKRKAAVTTQPNRHSVIKHVKPLKSGALTATPAYKIQHFNSWSNPYSIPYSKLLLKHDGTSAETRFRLSLKQMSPFKLVGVSLQSTAGSRGVHISVSNAG